ncbi:MAG: hypothetical protein WCA07_04930 [Gloeobacterales cyanobacterium]
MIEKEVFDHAWKCATVAHQFYVLQDLENISEENLNHLTSRPSIKWIIAT